MNAYLLELLMNLFHLCFNQCNASLHFGSSKHSVFQKTLPPSPWGFQTCFYAFVWILVLNIGGYPVQLFSTPRGRVSLPINCSDDNFGIRILFSADFPRWVSHHIRSAFGLIHHCIRIHIQRILRISVGSLVQFSVYCILFDIFISPYAVAFYGSPFIPRCSLSLH